MERLRMERLKKERLGMEGLRMERLRLERLRNTFSLNWKDSEYTVWPFHLATNMCALQKMRLNV
jgi:hypothetical protein